MSSASAKRSSTTRRSRRRSSDDRGRKAFLAAIDHLFVFAASKQSSPSPPPSAEEFLAEVEMLVASLRKTKTKTSKSKSKSKTSGGASARHSRMDAFLQGILGTAVGTFDTPCNRVMSYISIALYAVMFYSLAEAAQEVSMLSPQLGCMEVLSRAQAHPTYTQAIHTPTRWFFRRYLPALESKINTSIADIQHLLSERVTAYGNVCDASILVSLTYSGLQAFFTSVSYMILITQPIACLLYRAGMVSCRELCWILRRFTGSLGPRT